MSLQNILNFRKFVKQEYQNIQSYNINIDHINIKTNDEIIFNVCNELEHEYMEKMLKFVCMIKNYCDYKCLLDELFNLCDNDEMSGLSSHAGYKTDDDEIEREVIEITLNFKKSGKHNYEFNDYDTMKNIHNVIECLHSFNRIDCIIRQSIEMSKLCKEYNCIPKVSHPKFSNRYFIVSLDYGQNQTFYINSCINTENGAQKIVNMIIESINDVCNF